MKLRMLLGQTGVTILEVLITLGIAGIITTAVFKAYLTQHENYMTQDAVTNIQQNSRVVIDELTRQIRMAGNNLPLSIPAIVPANTNPDTITLSYRVGNCETGLLTTMSSSSSVIQCGSDISCFHDNQWAYIYEPDSGGGEMFLISNVDNGSRYLYHGTMALSKAYTNNALVMVVQQLKYYVDNVTDPDHPRLMLQVLGQPPQVFAEDISDLQLRYILKNNLVTDQPVLASDIREVKISITGSSGDTSGTKSFSTPSRIYTSSVNVRNL
ncbi:MAG: hypothetical protein PHU88_07305 [candidate division Zixibacteria bacterium]|nr:hypothetical protein [candidate division Zixibacteria bacterium]MDD5426718.1 hypothetical protein [candidate division Zixibacteria bacterium]